MNLLHIQQKVNNCQPQKRLVSWHWDRIRPACGTECVPVFWR
nr:MAG TPA: hypothetical protein [Caudoviricetes sp.]